MHDGGVGVHGGEGRAVAVLEGAEEEAWGGEMEGGGHLLGPGCDV